MGSVKPGYGPKEPDGRGWDASAGRSMPRYDDPDRKAKVARSDPRPAASASKSPRSGARGLSVDPTRARGVANEALQASKAVRAAKAKGVDDHDAQAHFNATMAALQQVHPGLHQSVLAIHHLETKISEAQRAGGKPPTGYDEMLRSAHRNLNARINKGQKFTYDPRKGK